MNISRRMFSQGSKVVAIGVLGLMLNACNSHHHRHHDHHDVAVAGYVYTSTNGQRSDKGANKVLRLTRYSDGTLGDEKVFDTHGTGAGDTAAGGEARGDFDSQDAIKIIGDYMLVVNAGSNTVTVFKVDKTNGDLSFMESVDSGGQLPVSIAVTKNSSVNGDYWVVVANQWGNPNIQGTVLDRVCYPQKGFFNDDCTITDPKEKDDGRNITLFNFDSSNGSLTTEKALRTYERGDGGPADAVFTGDGTKLAVSTWGVAHISAQPSAMLQIPSHVFVYDFDTGTGQIKNTNTDDRQFQFIQGGIAATVGINWAKDSDTIIHASNANLTYKRKLEGYGLTVLKDADGKVTLDQHFDTGNPEMNDAACWSLLSPSGDRVYVASFRTNEVTPYTTKPDGTIDKALPYAARAVSGDPDDINNNPDFKDMYISPDNHYLYVLGAFNTYTVNRFAVTDAGLKYTGQYVFSETAEARGNAGQYNFLGLTGFDIKK